MYIVTGGNNKLTRIIMENKVEIGEKGHSMCYGWQVDKSKETSIKTEVVVEVTSK